MKTKLFLLLLFPYLCFSQTYRGNITGNAATATTSSALSVGATINVANGVALTNIVQTNRVAWFGNTVALATNREPYWTGAFATGYSWMDNMGNSILNVFPKVPNGGGYIYYWGSQTNLAHAFSLGNKLRDSDQPRFVINYLVDEGGAAGDLDRQFAFHTNNIAFTKADSHTSVWAEFGDTGTTSLGATNFQTNLRGTNVTLTAGTNSLTITTNGFQRVGDFPFAYLEGDVTSMTSIDTTPASPTYAALALTNQMVVNATTGYITNLQAGLYEIGYSMPIAGDPVATGNPQAALYFNGTVYSGSTTFVSLEVDRNATISKTIIKNLAANTGIQVKVGGAVFGDGGGVTYATFYVKRL